VIYKACWRVRIGRDSLIKREAWGGVGSIASVFRPDHGEGRYMGERGRASGSCAVFLEQVASPREGWTSCPLAFALKSKMCLPGV
jgi:hypothetical protein